MTNSPEGVRRSLPSRALLFLAAPICVSLCVLTLGCSAGSASGDVEKAQIAVRANPGLELVATDDRQGVLTVKVRRTGRVITVSVADVISGVAFRDLDSDAPAAARGSGVTVSTPQGQVAVRQSRDGLAVSTPEGQVAVRQSPGGVAVSTPEGQVAVRQSRDGVAVSTPEGQVAVRQSGGAVGVATAERDPSARRPSGGVTVSTPESGTVAVRPTPGGVSVSTPETQVGVRQTRDGGLAVSTPEAQVKIGADGIRVQEASRAPAAGSARSAPASTGSSRQDASGRGANVDDARLNRQSRPVSCRADGTVNLVDVLLQVDGIAIDTVGGCRIFVRNSHIIGDVALQAVGGSTIVIENSIMEGRVALALQGSVNASVQSSTIRGPVSRKGSVNLRDLGGNLWQ
jgi:hypothetical protein